MNLLLLFSALLSALAGIGGSVRQVPVAAAVAERAGAVAAAPRARPAALRPVGSPPTLAGVARAAFAVAALVPVRALWVDRRRE